MISEYIIYNGFAKILPNETVEKGYEPGKVFRVLLKDRYKNDSILIITPEKPRGSWDLGDRSPELKLLQSAGINVNATTRVSWLTNWVSNKYIQLYKNEIGCKHSCDCKGKCELFELIEE